MYTRSQLESIRREVRAGLVPFKRALRRLIRKAEANRADAADAIRDYMFRHQPDAHPDGPHDAYLNSKTYAVRHVHHKDADRFHLDRVKADLASVPGVTAVHQDTKPPVGDTWERVYPEDEDDGGAGGTQGDGSAGVAKRYPTGPIRKCLDSLGPTATPAEIMRCAPWC
jgi:hypothetical protein